MYVYRNGRDKGIRTTFFSCPPVSLFHVVGSFITLLGVLVLHPTFYGSFGFFVVPCRSYMPLQTYKATLLLLLLVITPQTLGNASCKNPQHTGEAEIVTGDSQVWVRQHKICTMLSLFVFLFLALFFLLR